MKILLAIDGSKFSEAATQAVIAQAIPGKAEVRVVHVVDTMENPFPAMTEFDVVDLPASRFSPPRTATREARKSSGSRHRYSARCHRATCSHE